MEENLQSQELAQSQATEPSAQNSFTIPDSYKDRGWVEKIKSPDDLWKTLDNAQSLIGKRPAGIPTNDASDDEWNQFYKAMGRPDEPKYDFKDPEGLPEGFDTSPFKEQAAQILHKAGLTPKQADKVYNEYLRLELESANKQGEQSTEQQESLDEQYDKLTKEHFGDDAEKYENLFKEDFAKHVPQSLKETVGKLVDMPDVLTALMAYTKGKQAEIDRVKSEYGQEGNLSTGSQTSNQSIDDTRKELSTLRTSQVAKDFTHPDNKQTMARIQELQATIDRYYKK
jgi:hypothetical protein